MKYIPPFGVSDPEAAWVNGDPTVGRQGSIPPAAVFEQPQREIVSVIARSNITPSDTDLMQLTRSVRSQFLNYADDTSNTANYFIVTYDPPITSYTRGLVLRVRVRNTNTGACRINAGAGTVPIRKMNGADVGEGELPVGALATMVFDGTVFQLSNFGGGGGGGLGDVFMVKIPYTVDSSDTPGIIHADFLPAIVEIGAGDMIAVKVAQTAPGPTRIYINNLAPLNLLPNGGGQMLQGDVAAQDVVIFFFDGNDLRFAPNPEMNAPVTYSVGPGQQFASVDAAMAELKRKTIGARGYVTLQLIRGVFDGPINVSHPSGDRITIRGTMIGAAPLWNEFAATGNTAQQRAQDAIFNINMLRTRYGTEIRPPDQMGNAYGIQNSGPGAVTFADLLIVGGQLPLYMGFAYQQGVQNGSGKSCSCYNVTCWGCQVGFNNAGSIFCVSCFAIGSVFIGFDNAGGSASYASSAAIGSADYGFHTDFGSTVTQDCRALMNGRFGFSSGSNSGVQLWWTHSLGNGELDLYANVASSIGVIQPADFGTTSPPLWTVGNLGSTIANSYSERPPGV